MRLFEDVSYLRADATIYSGRTGVFLNSGKFANLKPSRLSNVNHLKKYPHAFIRFKV